MGDSVLTHFPRTKITRALCRRRNGEAVPRAENFGDLDNSRSQGVCYLGQFKLRANPCCYLGQLLLRPMSLRPGLSTKMLIVT